MQCLFVGLSSELYSASVNAVTHAISCYIGQHVNGTPLYHRPGVHIHVSMNQVFIDLGDGLAIVLYQAITWTNTDFDGLMQDRCNSRALAMELCLSLALTHWFNRTFETNCCEICIKIKHLSLKKMHVKMPLAKWWPFFPRLQYFNRVHEDTIKIVSMFYDTGQTWIPIKIVGKMCAPLWILILMV